MNARQDAAVAPLDGASALALQAKLNGPLGQRQRGRAAIADIGADVVDGREISEILGLKPRAEPFAGRRPRETPFGCRKAHRKQRSTERSVAYYGTAEGKAKKKMQNGKRAEGGARAAASPVVSEAEAAEFPAEMVRYVAMVVSLIEARPVSQQEIVRMLLRAMRQHSMARRRRIDYVVAQLHQHGP